MGLFKKFRGKSKAVKTKAEETGTVLRQPGKATPITKEKERAEHTALEIADQQGWEVKTLPVWQPGDVILDTYEVEDVISGGMGHVYIANHKNWNVKLAIKSPNEMMLSNKSLFARILREANSWTELGLHPNIAYCYYVRNIEEIPHIFVEYVDGGNLRQWIEEGKCIDFRTNLDLAIQFCHGMEHAHSKGMIHRDIKPENVLMTKDGILKITDFGLVRGDGTSFAPDGFEGGGTAQHQAAGLTEVGTLMGTAGYMAPEQAESARDVDERADIFSFGVCLYEMFCGNRPYEITMGPKQETPDPVSLSGDEDFSSDIATVLTKAVQWESSERYKSFYEIRQALLSIYRDLFGEESPYAELELLDLEADGLNNQGVSYYDLGRKENAVSCWEKALAINQLHPEATYNLSLILWRSGKVADDEVLRRLDNCGNNPAVQPEKLAELKAFIHAERLDFNSARNVLKGIPGRYEVLLPGKKVDQIGSIHSLKGHTSRILSIAISPDGRHAVSGSWDNTVRVWKLESGRCVRTLEGHTAGINSVAISPDGQHAVSGSGDQTVRVWELESGRCVRTLEGHTAGICSVAISPDGQHAVSGSGDETIRVWELEADQCVRIMEGHTSIVNSVSISPDGRYAVSGSVDMTLRLWELKSGRCVHTLKGHTNNVLSVSISPDGRYAVSGSRDQTVRVWELKSGRCVHTLKGHTNNVWSVAISPDGRHAVSGSGDETIRLWELESGRCIRTLEGHTDGIDSVAISPDGRYAVSGSLDLTVRVWKIITDTTYVADLRVSLLRGFKERKKEEDGLDQAISRIRTLYEKQDYSNSFSVLYEAWQDTGFSDNVLIRRLYSSLMKKGRIKGLNFSFQKRLLIGHTDAITSVAISPDGQHAVSGSGDQTVRLWELESGRCMRTLEGQTGWVWSVCLTPDRRYVVSGSFDNTLRVWELSTGRCMRTLEGHTDYVESVCLTPDGCYAVSGSRDKTLKVWELATGRCERTQEGHTAGICSVAISPDGQHAVSGSGDETIRVWELEAGQCVRIMEGHTGTVQSVAISPDGRHAVSGSVDMTLRLWELKSGRCVHTLKGHTNWVVSVAISPDGRYAVSGSRDETVRLWELETGQCVRIMEGHTSIVVSVALTPDGLYAVSGSGDQTIRVWELIWDLEFPDPVAWDEGVRPYLDIFLTLRNGKWIEDDFQELIKEIAERRGYRWVRPEGIRKELEKMTEEYKTPKYTQKSSGTQNVHTQQVEAIKVSLEEIRRKLEKMSKNSRP